MALAAGIGVVGGAAYFGSRSFGLGRSAGDRPLTVVVRREPMRIVVTERGNLESVVTVDGVCELMGHQNKIIELVPEGTHVKKDQIVTRFDSSEIDKNIAQQEIKAKQAEAKIQTTEQEVEIARNKGEEDKVAAEVEYKIAELNLTKYEMSDLPAEISDLKGLIAQDKSKSEEARDKRDQTKELVRKGFRSPEQLRTEEQAYEQFTFFLQRDQQKLEGKQKYESQAKRVEFESKRDQAKGKRVRAEATAKATVAKANSEFESAKALYQIEDAQLKEFLKQKDKTTIKAAQDGVVAYANEPWYDSSRQIREGATVFSRQKIFSLPDMTRMQVKVNIHESLVKKVKAGQKAEIKVDAFPNLTLFGVVKNVSQLADSNLGWMNGGAKEYKTVVTIEKMPDEELKPGMTAEVRINVKLLSEALVVPLQAVAEHKGAFYAFVEAGSGAVGRREVKVGETNEKMIQILDGLAEGERILLDARARAEVEFKDDSPKDGGPKPGPGPLPGDAGGGPVASAG